MVSLRPVPARLKPQSSRKARSTGLNSGSIAAVERIVMRLAGDGPETRDLGVGNTGAAAKAARAESITSRRGRVTVGTIPAPGAAILGSGRLVGTSGGEGYKANIGAERPSVVSWRRPSVSKASCSRITLES